MTLNEFKAWLSGFTDGMHGAPSDRQWTKIKKRMEQIDGEVTTKTVFVDRYPNFGPWWNNTMGGGAFGTGGEPLRIGSGGFGAGSVSNGNYAGSIVENNLICYNSAQTAGGFSEAISYEQFPTGTEDMRKAYAELGREEAKAA